MIGPDDESQQAPARVAGGRGRGPGSRLARRVRAFFTRVRKPTAGAAAFANRFNAMVTYVLELMLWSRIFASPTPLQQTARRLAERGIACPAPTLHLSADHREAEIWESGFDAVYSRLLVNLQRPDLLSAIRYARPSPAFQGVYLWDSAFIAQIWKLWDPLVALDINRAVLALADEDRLQHVVAHFVKSTFTQPPLIAWSLWRVFQWTGDASARETIERAYPTLSRFNDWLYRHRRLEDGLFFWAHPYESGVENAPRFSSRDEKHRVDTTRLASPDFAAYMLIQNETLEAMANELGRTSDRARFRERAEALRAALNERLWCEEAGLYFDRDVRTGRFVPSQTIASLLPLWAGAPDASRASRMLERIMDEGGFNTPTPLPSVARDDPDFARDMWRGAVWLNTAYAVLLGMERYGFTSEASDFAYRLAEAVYQTHASSHSIFEFFDPERHDVSQLARKRGNRWKKFTLGDKPRPEFVGWSGLANNLVIEHLLGFNLERGRIVLRPRMPERAIGRAFAVRLPAWGVSLELEALASGRTRGALRRRGETIRFELAFGEAQAVDLPTPHRGDQPA